MTRPELFRLDGAETHSFAVDAWLDAHAGALGDLARYWFQQLRACGDEVQELLHDNCPVACFGNAAFAYIAIFRAYTSVGFYQGSDLPDPARLLQGTGKFMRHVKIRPDVPLDTQALQALIESAYANAKEQTEAGL